MLQLIEHIIRISSKRDRSEINSALVDAVRGHRVVLLQAPAGFGKTSLLAALVGVGALMFVALVRRGPAMGVATSWLAVLGLAVFLASYYALVLGLFAALAPAGRARAAR